MARNGIKIHFQSSKMGGGSQSWPACKPFGDIHSICPWANTPIIVVIVIIIIIGVFYQICKCIKICYEDVCAQLGCRRRNATSVWKVYYFTLLNVYVQICVK